MILKEASNTENHARPWWFTNSARTAFEALLRGVVWKEGTSLLMPAYIGFTEREGSGVFDPVRKTGTPYTFYPLGERLEIDLGSMGAMLATGKHPMLLVIHYFGLAHVDMGKLRELCHAHGTLLVEDCAHVPGPVGHTTDLGTYGDAAIYSLHKVLPMPDGGVLRLNNPKLPRPVLKEGEGGPASTLEQVLRADMAAIAADRIRNYVYLLEKLRDVDGLEILYPSLGGQVPHNFPIRVKDGLREKLYFALMEDGMPTIALYYRMIQELPAVSYPLSHALATDILNLPVHQDTTLADLEALCGAIKSKLEVLRT